MQWVRGKDQVWLIAQAGRLVAIDQDPFDGNLHSHLWNGQLAASSRPQAPTKAEVKKQFTHNEKKTAT